MKILIAIIIIYIVTEIIINCIRHGAEKVDDHGHAIKKMGKQKLSEILREWIASREE